jgi:protein PsiE
MQFLCEMNLFKKMLRKFSKNWRKFVAEIFHLPTVLILISIGILFVGLIFKNFYFVVIGAVSGDLNSHEIIEKIFLIFLEIEIVASIKIYFNSNFHFPLRFFLYIGITDLVRSLIVRQNDPHAVLFFAIAIVLTIASLKLWEFRNSNLKKVNF